MAFQKGRKKTGGRKKGSLNKDTKEIRNFLKTLINETQIKQDLEDLEPIERLNFLVKLLPYIVPKQKEIDLKTQNVHNIIDLGSGKKPFEGFNFLPTDETGEPQKNN